MSQVVMVDVDGVLANYNYGINQIVMHLYGIELPKHPRDIPDWYHCSNTVGKKRWSVVWDIATRNPSFLSDLPPLASPKEFESLNTLGDNHDVYYVTHRSAFGSKSITEQWLEDQGIRSPTVVLSGQKGVVARAIGADYIIEDSVDNILGVRVESPETKTYLMLYPYNSIAKKLVTKCVTSVQEFIIDILAA